MDSGQSALSKPIEVSGSANSKPTAIRPGGRDVHLFSEPIYQELRATAMVPDDFVNGGWDMSDLQDGGGKGGTLMSRVGVSYIVKELSKSDHEVLLKLTGPYAQHVRSGDTLLCPIYLHFMDLISGRNFFVMKNCVGPGPFQDLYDLKACADDKLIEHDGKAVKTAHKRIWNVGMWLGTSSWTDERRIYYDGKTTARNMHIPLTPKQRTMFMRCIERDAAWLAENRLMDYSLLVAVKGQPVDHKTAGGTDTVVFVAIIDFLQKWTNGKRVARFIKVLETNKATIPPASYAKRFLQHFQARVNEVADENSVGAATTLPLTYSATISARSDGDGICSL